MTKLETIVGPSCLTDAADDEPLFILKATDEDAPDTVRDWCSRKLKRHIDAGTLTKERIAKINDAQICAVLMERWRRERGS